MTSLFRFSYEESLRHAFGSWAEERRDEERWGRKGGGSRCCTAESVTAVATWGLSPKGTHEVGHNALWCDPPTTGSLHLPTTPAPPKHSLSHILRHRHTSQGVLGDFGGGQGTKRQGSGVRPHRRTWDLQGGWRRAPRLRQNRSWGRKYDTGDFFFFLSLCVCIFPNLFEHKNLCMKHLSTSHAIGKILC